MDFDQMLDAWKAQDEAPLYGVNSDLLQHQLEQVAVHAVQRLLVLGLPGVQHLIKVHRSLP